MKYCVWILLATMLIVAGCRKLNCGLHIVSPQSSAVYHSGDSILFIFSFPDYSCDSQCVGINNYASGSYNYVLSTDTFRAGFKAYARAGGRYSIKIPFTATGTDTLQIAYGSCVAQPVIYTGPIFYIQP